MQQNTQNRERNRIIASLPEISSAHPVPALLNFVMYQLNMDLEYRTLDNHDANSHVVQVYLNKKLIATAEDRRKKVARELAAREVLIRLNRDRNFLNSLIDSTLTERLQRQNAKNVQEQVVKVGYHPVRLQQTLHDHVPRYGKTPTGGLDDDIDEYKNDVSQWHKEVTDWEMQNGYLVNKNKKIVQDINNVYPPISRNFRIKPTRRQSLSESSKASPSLSRRRSV
jgi:hypothetical protein